MSGCTVWGGEGKKKSLQLVVKLRTGSQSGAWRPSEALLKTQQWRPIDGFDQQPAHLPQLVSQAASPGN